MTKEEIEKIVSEIKKMFDKTGEIPSSFVDKVKDYLGKTPLPLQFYFWGLLAEQVPDALDFFNSSDEKPVTTVYIPPVLVKVARIKAIIEGISLSEFVRRSIIKWLKEDVEKGSEGVLNLWRGSSYT